MEPNLRHDKVCESMPLASCFLCPTVPGPRLGTGGGAVLPQCHWASRSSSPRGSCTSPGAGQPASCGMGSPGCSMGTVGHSPNASVPSIVPGAVPTHSALTCRSSSSFTRDQVLMKLSLRRARMGELSRTVSRRVRPEPVQGEARPEE